MEKEEQKGLGIFEKYLTLWVALCMVTGVLIGKYLPAVPATLGKFEYYQVSIPTAILIWLMIYPMMLKIDFTSIVNAAKKPKGLIVTCTVNWLIKHLQCTPFQLFSFSLYLKGLSQMI